MAAQAETEDDDDGMLDKVDVGNEPFGFVERAVAAAELLPVQRSGRNSLRRVEKNQRMCGVRRCKNRGE